MKLLGEVLGLGFLLLPPTLVTLLQFLGEAAEPELLLLDFLEGPAQSCLVFFQLLQFLLD